LTVPTGGAFGLYTVNGFNEGRYGLNFVVPTYREISVINNPVAGGREGRVVLGVQGDVASLAKFNEHIGSKQAGRAVGFNNYRDPIGQGRKVNFFRHGHSLTENRPW